MKSARLPRWRVDQIAVRHVRIHPFVTRAVVVDDRLHVRRETHRTGIASITRVREWIGLHGFHRVEIVHADIGAPHARITSDLVAIETRVVAVLAIVRRVQIGRVDHVGALGGKLEIAAPCRILGERRSDAADSARADGLRIRHVRAEVIMFPDRLVGPRRGVDIRAATSPEPRNVRSLASLEDLHWRIEVVPEPAVDIFGDVMDGRQVVRLAIAAVDVTVELVAIDNVRNLGVLAPDGLRHPGSDREVGNVRAALLDESFELTQIPQPVASHVTVSLEIEHDFFLVRRSIERV